MFNFSKKIILLSFLSFNVLALSAQHKSYIFGTKKITILKGDITEQDTDAIVNAANQSLWNGDGVCGAIFKAAGPEELEKACDEIPEVDNIRCKTGEARITDSFRLAKNGVKKIIHAVGPDCRISDHYKRRKEILSSTYKNSIELADQNDLASISFPSISTGIYRYPTYEAALVALEAIIDSLKNSKTIQEVKIVLFGNTTYNDYCSILDGKLHEDVDQEVGDIDEPARDIPARSENVVPRSVVKKFPAFKAIAALGGGLLAGLLAYKYFKRNKSKN